MRKTKFLPISIAAVIISISLFSGCIGRTIDTFGWDHINTEGTSVRIWGQLAITENSNNWNEGFVYDTEFHQDWKDYQWRAWADNYQGLGFFSLNIDNLSRTTEYHYRAFGEYLEGPSQYRFGADAVFIPGGPRVSTDYASDIDLTSVTFKGNLSHMGGAVYCTVYFLYGTDKDALNQKTTPGNMTEVGSFTATLSGLVTNTTYYYKAVAENDADTWAGFIFNVAPGRPLVISRQPGEIGKDSALLKAELWNTGGPTSCSVWFVYSDISPNQLDQKTPPQPMNATGPFQATIENLNSSTKYWYRAVGDNGVAQGVGDIIEFTTTPTAQIHRSDDGQNTHVPPAQISDDDLTSRIPDRYQQLFQKHPVLLKLLQHPRIRALLSRLS